MVTLVRPKKHSIHPSDLHILINTVQSSSSVNFSAAASWLPICLPKFNPAAFVNAYVTFLQRKDAGLAPSAPTPTLPAAQPASVVSSAPEQVVPASSSSSIRVPPHEPETRASTRPTSPETIPQSETAASIASLPSSPVEVGLICVSGLGDFDAVRSWCSLAAEVKTSLQLDPHMLINTP